MPKWLKKYLDLTGIDKIEKAVAEAERQTSGEIVPMVVYRSSTVGHIPLMIYSLGLLVYYFLGISDYLYEFFGSTWWSIVVWAIALFPVTLFLTKLTVVQRAFVNSLDRELQSRQRALNEFYKAGLNKTDGSTGILLFVSVVDHQAVVLADEAIASQLDPSIWSEVVDLLVRGIRSNKMEEGFCEAIKKCSEILKGPFPIQPDDVNELPNKLVIKD